MNPPLITIITCTYNSQAFLKDSLISVANQTFKNIEHIFVDGFSTDATESIIKTYQPNAIIIKQKPQGIYPALNEGIKQAQGEIIGFLHADDLLFDNSCLARVADAFMRNPSLGYYCSKMLIYDQKLKESFAVLGSEPHIRSWKEKLYSSTYFAHPTYYCKKKVIDQVGYYNENYSFAADIDWLYRLEKLKIPYFFDCIPFIKFRSSGSTSQYYLKALAEEFKITKQYEKLSLGLLSIYSWHFARRLIRWLLTTLQLNKFVMKARKVIIKTFKN